MKRASSIHPLIFALWCAGLAAAATVLSIALPGEAEQMVRASLAAIAALGTVGAAAFIVQARRTGQSAGDITVLARLIDTAEGACVITGPDGVVVSMAVGDRTLHRR